MPPPTQSNVRSKSGSKGGVLVAVGVLVLALLGAGAWLLLRPPAPGTIQFTTSPSDPVVLFDEQPVQATASPFVIPNVEPETTHLIEVRKRGYRTWSTQVTLSPGQNLQLAEVTLEPEEGGEAVAEGGAGFSLSSEPSGATVLVDGERKGTTPITVEDLEAGEHTIRVELEGRAPWETTLSLSAGRVLALQPVELGSAQVTVRFVSDPEGARVYLVRGDERRRVGTTPVRESVDVSGDPWTVEMTRSGYEDWSEELEVPEGEEAFTIEAELDREERVAVAPRMTTRMTTPSRMTDSTPPRMTSVMAAPMGGTGTLRINSRPWSQVYVDGRLIGNTPQMNISLSAGSHRVTLVNPDFNVRHTVNVNITAGETTTRIVPLPVN